MKIPNKRELKQIGSNHLYDIKSKDLMKHYKKYTKELLLVLVNNTILL